MNRIKDSPVVSVFALLAVLVSMLSMTNYMNERETVQGFWRSRMAALSLSDKLRQTSDDLTRMVRLYAVNGDPVYREYFDEILDIRNGIEPRPEKYFDVPYRDIVLDSGERTGEGGEAVAIRTRAGNAGLTEAEFAEFVRAEDASNALAEIENEIMDVIAAQIDASGGDYVLEGETLQAMLRLHGPEYHAAKAQVMQPLVELERKVEEAYATWIDAVIEFNDLTLNLGVYTLAAAFLLTLAGMWLRRR